MSQLHLQRHLRVVLDGNIRMVVFGEVSWYIIMYFFLLRNANIAHPEMI